MFCVSLQHRWESSEKVEFEQHESRTKNNPEPANLTDLQVSYRGQEIYYVSMTKII